MNKQLAGSHYKRVLTVIFGMLVPLALTVSGCQNNKFAAVSPLKIDPDHAAKARTLLETVAGQGFKQIPFTNFNTAHHANQVLFDPQTRQSQLIVDQKTPIRFQRQGIPIKILELSNNRLAVFFRDIFSSRLQLVDVNLASGHQDWSQLKGQEDIFFFFRNAVAAGNQIVGVFYSNKDEANYLKVFDVQKNRLVETDTKVKLPSLDDPAGSHYEMIPALYMIPDKDRVYLMGGTLTAYYQNGSIQGVKRVENCQRVLEAVDGEQGVNILCGVRKASKTKQYFLIYDLLKDQSSTYEAKKGLPWHLHTQDQKLAWDYAGTPEQLREMFVFDIERGKGSGTFNLGINNIEGRIPWSQMYYLNGLMDIIMLAQRDEQMYKIFHPLLPQLRQRLDMEIGLIDQLLQTDYYFKTRAFTVHREEALFAVQTGRLLLLFNRYRREIPNPIPLQSFERVKKDVFTLKNHIDVLSQEGESEKWLKKGRYHLRWPKGSAFYFDGVAVPYNHQNEWSYAILNALEPGDEKRYPKAVQAAKDIIAHFHDRMLKDGQFPRSGEWDYWWGQAYDGWKASDQVSLNKAEYPGDQSKAWISFKSIDTMSLLNESRLSGQGFQKLSDSALKLVNRGKLYPFVSYELVKGGVDPALSDKIVQQYIRVSSPWELQNASWAYLRFPLERE